MAMQDFSRRSTQTELTDDLTLEGDASSKNMRELEAVNFWLGGKKTLISALNTIYQKHSHSFEKNRIVIGDLGCGGGDLLRDVHDWVEVKKLNADLIGIDANPFVVQSAIKKSPDYKNIQFKTLNVLSDEFKAMSFDVVCLNSFCHHLSDPNLTALLKQLRQQTSTAIIINDLHRHRLAYLSIQLISRLLNFSYLSLHDGPMSVLRAFRKNELVDLLKSADFTHYHIRWRWAFRWEILIWIK